MAASSSSTRNERTPSEVAPVAVAQPKSSSPSGQIVAFNSDDNRSNAASEGPTRFHYTYPGCYRWVLMLFCLLTSMIAGPSAFNWPPFDDMFNWANANSHLCDPSDPTYELRAHGEIYCHAKALAIENIAGTAVSVLYVFDFVGGIMLDTFGAKITCLFGISLQVLGWLLIAVSNSRTFKAYTAGVCLFSAGADPTFFGLISVSNLFPNWTSTAIATIGTIRSVAFANGLMMRAVWSSNRTSISLRGIAFVWAGCIAVIGIGVIFLIPWQVIPKLQALETDEQLPELRKHVQRKPKIDVKQFVPAKKRQVKLVADYLRRWTFLVLILVACVQLVRNNYFANTYKEHLPNTKGFYEISSPLSFIPCPFMGILADRVSSAYSLALTVLTAALSMLFATFRAGTFMECVSIVFNWVFQSFTSSEFYVYLAYNYPLHVYGKLAGITLLVGGLVGLLGGPMNTYAVENDKYVVMDVLVTCLGAAAVVLALVLHFSVERQTRRRKQLLKQEVTGDEAVSHV